MFRQDELFFGGWQEKTLDAMQRRRFEQLIRQLPPLGAERLEALEPGAFERRIEQSWQDIERKPMRSQQMAQIWNCVLSSIELQADCLSHEEHDLVERAIVLGGSAQIEDMQELEAARALYMRLWANVGMVSGRPYIELERQVLHAVAKAFSRSEHEEIRGRLERFHSGLTGMLYRLGVMDDRQPQMAFLRDVLMMENMDERHIQVARRYLWAGFDCIDYSGGVMLVHCALAEPRTLIRANMRRTSGMLFSVSSSSSSLDILPEEVPLQSALERSISGTLRDGFHAHDTARTIRFLCKQGAPLSALEETLQASLIVCISPAMRGALTDMYYRLPKWMECTEHSAKQ